MLPTNINGERENATIILEVDVASPRVPSGSRINSKHRQEDALRVVMAECGDSARFDAPYNQEWSANWCEEDVAYLYTPGNRPEKAYMVIGSGAYADLIEHPGFGRGSNLVADERLHEAAADALIPGGANPLSDPPVRHLLEEALQAA